MDKVLSVEDFIGGLLKHGGNVNGSWKMGLGRRTDSEAAFQVQFYALVTCMPGLAAYSAEKALVATVHNYEQPS